MNEDDRFLPNLRGLAEDLQALTHTWDYRGHDYTSDELDALFGRWRADTLATVLKVRHGHQLGEELLRRLRGPRKRLARLEHFACEVLTGARDITTGKRLSQDSSVPWDPRAINRLLDSCYKHYGRLRETMPAAEWEAARDADPVVQRLENDLTRIQNDLRDMAEWLCQVLEAISPKAGAERLPAENDEVKWSPPATHKKWEDRLGKSNGTLRRKRRECTIEMQQVKGERDLWQVAIDDPLYVNWVNRGSPET